MSNEEQLELPGMEGVSYINRTAEFDAELVDIVKDRGERYGHPLDDFETACKIKDALRACPDPVIRHALTMIGVKMARLCTSPDHLDSIKDIAGYARTIAMILDERERRNSYAAIKRRTTT